MRRADDDHERDARSNPAGSSGLRGAADDTRPDRASGSSPAANERMMGRYVLAGTVVGVILAHLIGWIPVIGAFFTGFIAGAVTRTRTRGLYASFVPAIFTMAWYWLITYLPDMPWGWTQWLAARLASFDVLLFGASALVFSFILMSQFLFTVIGGWLGGYMMERRAGRGFGHPI